LDRSAALATALLPVVLLTPLTARAAALASPAAWPAYCAGPLPAVAPPLDHGTLLNPDDHSDLVLATPGLPGNTDGGTPAPTAIAAGSGWHYFELTTSLPVQSVNSDLPDSPHDLKWIVFVSYGPGKSGLDASDVQYQNGGAWSDLGEWDGSSTRLMTDALDINSASRPVTTSVRLRFKIDATALAGPAYIVEFGSYVDAEQSCTHFTFAVNMLTVGAPGSAPGGSRSLEYAGAGTVVGLAAGAAIVLVTRRRKRS
jgi:hypothetical protein